jgi:CheY-like chemotaxis protein
VFSFELVLEAHNQPAPGNVTGARITGYSGERRRLLIADDEQTNRTLLVKLLGGLGFETREAGNGAEALKAISAALPDVLITDLAMPVMDGLAVARALRRDPRTRDLPILAVSASASDYTREEAISAGCSEFLPKPIRAAELLERLAHLSGIEWTTATPESTPESTASNDSRRLPIDIDAAAELYDLAMKGEVKALISRAEAAMRANPDNAPVYEELRALALRYDMKAVRRRIDDAREVDR